jgi:hypothetical protein
MVREMIAMNARASVAGSDDAGKYDNMIND